MKTSKSVGIIGAGVSGLSCAIILQNAGYNVTIISKDHPRGKSANAAFASFFPSASIIPHSVFSDDVLTLFKNSLPYFEKLYRQKFPGLTINEHYELYGYNKPVPDYADFVDNLHSLDTFKQSWQPVHPKFQIVSGWKFDCYFADWAIYYPALLKRFLLNGGNLEIRILNKKAVAELDWPVVINCAGLGAAHLFDEPEREVFRGHLVHVKGAPLLKNQSGKTVSYNISPDLQLPSNKEQYEPIDVYCYPRQDGWILGGSRQQGVIDGAGNWVGEDSYHPTEKINGNEVPAYILELNREIINHSFGINLDNYQDRAVKTGFRYIRSTKNGLQLKMEEKDDKLFIHNYGHGGAGVTLSWGCALKVAALIENKIGS